MVKNFFKVVLALIGMVCALFLLIALIGCLGDGGDDPCTKCWVFLRDMPISFILIVFGLAIYFLCQLAKYHDRFVGNQ